MIMLILFLISGGLLTWGGVTIVSFLAKFLADAVSKAILAFGVMIAVILVLYYTYHFLFPKTIDNKKEVKQSAINYCRAKYVDNKAYNRCIYKLSGGLNE